MNSVIKQVFLIIGAMVVSLLLYTLVFGDLGKRAMWTGLEPAFQKNWDRYTYDDGERVGEVLTDIFDSAIEVHH